MMHKAWSSIDEVLYRFSRSSIKFQGHTALKIVEFDPNWVFPDSNSSFNTPMAPKLCIKLERFRDPTITDTVTVSEQPHVTSSLSVFVNAKPVESCFEKRTRLVQFLVELLSLNSTK